MLHYICKQWMAFEICDFELAQWVNAQQDLYKTQNVLAF